MKQTKAAFRNKPFISLKGSILFLILIPMSGLVHAQYSMGTTGQLMIPTAEMQETGTFMGGVNFLPEQVTPSDLSIPNMNKYDDMKLFCRYDSFLFYQIHLPDDITQNDNRYRQDGLS